MGFSKAKAAQEISVAMSVDTTNEKNELERVNVVHTFRRPTMKEREAYRQASHSWQAGKPRLNITKANLLMWDTCITKVEGYDDLPVDNWKSYFMDDDIGRAHADSAARIMLDQISEVEEELEKK